MRQGTTPVWALRAACCALLSDAVTATASVCVLSAAVGA
jgi:hypothetical protein